MALLITALGMKKKGDDAYVSGLVERVALLEESNARKDVAIARLEADKLSAIDREQQANRAVARLWREIDDLRHT